jgi:hypothetical protein
MVTFNLSHITPSSSYSLFNGGCTSVSLFSLIFGPFWCVSCLTQTYFISTSMIPDPRFRYGYGTPSRKGDKRTRASHAAPPLLHGQLWTGMIYRLRHFWLSPNATPSTLHGLIASVVRTASRSRALIPCSRSKNFNEDHDRGEPTLSPLVIDCHPSDHLIPEHLHTAWS